MRNGGQTETGTEKETRKVANEQDIMIQESRRLRDHEDSRGLKQRRRQRLRERHFKIEIRVIVISSRLFLLFQYGKYVAVSQNEADK